MNLTIRAAGSTSIGLVRKNNEDAFFVDERLGLFIVSDGMGGAQAGEVAAQLVTTAFPRVIRTRLKSGAFARSSTIRSWLQRDLLELSQTIYKQSWGNPMAEGMGATVVLALVKGGQVHVAHMGDSRAYLYRQDLLTQLTQDHSIVSLLLREGEITETEAKRHPARGNLTRFIGMKEEVFGDVRSITLRPGDRLLLCTDGLSGMIPDRDVCRILKACSAPEQACRSLIDAANRAGGRDNVTAVVVNVDTTGTKESFRGT